MYKVTQFLNQCNSLRNTFAMKGGGVLSNPISRYPTIQYIGYDHWSSDNTSLVSLCQPNQSFFTCLSFLQQIITWYWVLILPMGHIFCIEIKILNSGSHDVSQKLRQTKCILFKIWRLKCTILPKKAIWRFTTWQNWCFGQSYHSKMEK